jgi:Skp family chaperone for outer membrane proteins
MQQRRPFWILTLVAIAAVSGAFVQQAMTPTVVAVADMDRVIAAYAPFVEGMRQLQQTQDTYAEESRNLQSRIDELEVEIDLATGAKQREKALTSDLLRMELRERTKAWQQELAAQRFSLQLRMFAEVQPLILEFCQRRGIEVLLRDRPWEQTGDLQRDLDQMARLQVLYHAERIDVTDALAAVVKAAK